MQQQCDGRLEQRFEFVVRGSQELGGQEAVEQLAQEDLRQELPLGLSSQAEVLALKHESKIFRQSSNPVCGFSMMEQVRLSYVWPTEIWLGSS